MNDGDGQTAVSAHTTAEPDISPVPPLFWWSVAIPAFCVVVWGMQALLAPRVPLADVLASRRESDGDR
ncbi:MAG: hypothetical protein H6736_03440 [Alphaproteobacteria bacterium]|nr:hypothetical protein [Alphaproteobacteria bacterium]MCB9690849.1 hypothetical protein [Alphaproteobacteria bacterium]